MTDPCVCGNNHDVRLVTVRELANAAYPLCLPCRSRLAAAVGWRVSPVHVRDECPFCGGRGVHDHSDHITPCFEPCERCDGTGVAIGSRELPDEWPRCVACQIPLNASDVVFWSNSYNRCSACCAKRDDEATARLSALPEVDEIPF